MVRANKGAAEKELNHQPNLQAGEVESWLKKLRDMTGEVPSPDPSLYLPEDMNKVSSCSFSYHLSIFSSFHYVIIIILFISMFSL